MNWQRKHEEVLTQLDELAGRKVQQFDRDTAHLSGMDLVKAQQLNGWNTIYVRRYYFG